MTLVLKKPDDPNRVAARNQHVKDLLFEAMPFDSQDKHIEELARLLSACHVVLEKIRRTKT